MTDLTFARLDETYGIDRALREPRRHRLAGSETIHLDVRSPTSASWVFYYFLGRRKELGLGSAFGRDGVELTAKARRLAAIYEGKLAEGLDPQRMKREAKTFGELFEDEIADRETAREKGKPWAEAQTWRSWSVNYFARLMPMQPKHIDRHVVADTLRKNWRTKRETASRARYVIEAVMTRAIAAELYPEGKLNPADKGIIEGILGKERSAADAKRHASIPYADAPALLARVLKPKTGHWRLMGNARKCLVVNMILPNRAGELHNMQRDHLKRQADGSVIWEVPADDNKREKAQRNILPWQVVEIINSIPAIAGNPFVFWGENPGTHIHESRPLEVLRKDMKVGKDVTDIHGMRQTITSWGQDETNADDETLANALSHGAITGKHFKRYATGEKLKKRGDQAQRWADYIFPKDFNDGVVSLAA